MRRALSFRSRRKKEPSAVLLGVSDTDASADPASSPNAVTDQSAPPHSDSKASKFFSRLPSRPAGRGAKDPPALASLDPGAPLEIIEATFGTGSLGCGISTSVGGEVIVTSVDLESTRAKGVREGLCIVGVNEQPTAGLDKAGIIGLIKASSRPMTLRLARPKGKARPKPSAIDEPIPWTQIQMGEKIAEGSAGSVFKCKYMGGASAAIKVLKLRRPAEELIAEFRVMKQLKHPSIVLMLGYAHDGSPLGTAMLMELMQASLQEIMSEPLFNHLTQFLTWRSFLLACASDVANGMQYLHSLHMVHRDLKPGNIMLTKAWQAKVADFGETGNAHDSEDSVVGTLPYMAPEATVPGPVEPAADVWGFGCCLVTFASLKIPYSDKGWKEPGQYISALQTSNPGQKAQPLTLLTEANCPATLRALAQQCTQWDTSARPDFEAIAAQLVREVTIADVYGAAEAKQLMDTEMTFIRPDTPMRKRAPGTEMARNLALAPQPKPPPPKLPQNFKDGARVYVKRSSGEESFGFVATFDPCSGLYDIALGEVDSEERKMADETLIHLAEEADPTKPRWAVGTRLLVKRSDGSLSPCFVTSYKRRDKVYLVQLIAEGQLRGTYKNAYENMLQVPAPAPLQPTSNDMAAITALSMSMREPVAAPAAPVVAPAAASPMYGNNFDDDEGESAFI